ncbi:MAG: substrate-binding domain-containing protein, partial [Phycisphaeraceae bacterium]|nr:substrate-binding domain-containing protein [Phycisphaeraceae bacterium]
MMRQRRVDGLILSPHHHNRDFYIQLRDAGVKMVFVDTRYEDLDIPYVCSDDLIGGRLLGQHLASCGYRQVGMLHIRPYSPYDTLAPRRIGCEAALKDAGVTVVEEWVEHTDVGEEGQRNAARRLLDRCRCEAIVVPTDIIAFEVMQAIKAAGLRIPEDIALAGYGNLKECEYVVPSLTSVDQRTEDMGRTAVQLLLEQIKDADAPLPSPVKTTPYLVPRQSTRMLPAAQPVSDHSTSNSLLSGG